MGGCDNFYPIHPVYNRSKIKIIAGNYRGKLWREKLLREILDGNIKHLFYSVKM